MDKEEWLRRYKARMIERGLNETEAEEITEVQSTIIAAEPEVEWLEDNPEDAADDELSYWASDG